MEDNLKRCMLCGYDTAKYYQKEVAWTIKDKGQVKLKLWGTWCTTCDDGIISGKDRDKNHAEFLRVGIRD